MPNYTGTAEVGIFSLSGQAVTGRAARRATADVGIFTLSSRGTLPSSGIAGAGTFSLAGQVASGYASTDDLVFYDGIAEWTETAGTGGEYVLGGALRENNTFTSHVGEGKQVYASIRDSVRYEHVLARFAKPNKLIRIEIDRSSNSNAAVDWPSTGRRIVKLEPAAAAFIRALRAFAALTSYKYRAPLSGDTITLDANDKALQIDPAGTIAALTVVLPPSPKHRDTVEISTSQTITTLTVSPAGAETVMGGSFMLTANGGASWRYRSGNTTWFKRY